MFKSVRLFVVICAASVLAVVFTECRGWLAYLFFNNSIGPPILKIEKVGVHRTTIYNDGSRATIIETYHSSQGGERKTNMVSNSKTNVTPSLRPHHDDTSKSYSKVYTFTVPVSSLRDSFNSSTVHRMATATSAVTTTVPPHDDDVASKKPQMGLLMFSEELFLVNAYSDLRSVTATVRIIVYASKNFREELYCYDAKQAHPARLEWINFVLKERAIWRAGYITCEVPSLQRSTAHVTVSSEAHSVTVPIFHAPEPDKKDTFGLCVKSGYGSPSAARFVEWMEMNLILGVSHVIVYDQSIHGPVRKAMQFYSNVSQLTVVTDIFMQEIERTLPTFKDLFTGFDATQATGDEPFSQMELLSIQDCFHRFRGRFEYIVVADIDEIIIPTVTRTLHQLLATLKSKSTQATSFAHQSASYLTDFTDTTKSTARANNLNTSYTHMLTYTRRTSISWEGSKAFHSTVDTEVLNWHRRIVPARDIAYVDPSDAWLHHYRNTCKGESCNAENRIFDDELSIMSKYTAELTERVDTVTKLLSLI